MVIVLGKITLQSADETDRVLGALIVRAQKSRADKGNIEYSFSRSLEDAKEILLKAVVKAYDGLNERVLMTR